MATEFRLLGPVEVYARGRSIDIGPARHQSVLAALLYDANRSVSADQLVERVWGDDRLPKRPRNAVHTYISLLKRSLAESVGATIVRRSHGYMVELDADLLDLHRFRSLLEKAGSGHDGAVTLYEQAFALWRGEALSTLDTPWAQRIRRVLDAEYLAAEADLTDIQLAVGRHTNLVATLAARSAARPMDERLAGQLILALSRSGRQAEALQHYHRIRQHLAEELGTEPGHPLRLLYQQLLAADVSFAVPSTDPAPSTAPAMHAAADPAVPRQLPADISGFAGRCDTLHRMDAFLGPTPNGGETKGLIIGVSGPAGVGKTALAVHWAHLVEDRFPDGQLYADLHGFDERECALEASEVVQDILQALGVPAARIPATLDGRAALYRSMLTGKRILVVLDNARDAAQVRPLIPGTPTAVTLVTSRDQLTSLVATNAAQPLSLGPLTRGEAGELLARRLGDALAIARPDEVEAILTACAGLPLALTIAAARSQQAGPSVTALTDLAAELASPERRLDALDGGDPASRLRTVFSWSYATLSPAAARLFRLLGTNPGLRISTAAAADLAALSRCEAWRLLSELARASLLAEHSPGDYVWHDLLLTYAKELHEAQDGDQAPRASESRTVPPSAGIGAIEVPLTGQTPARRRTGITAL